MIENEPSSCETNGLVPPQAEQWVCRRRSSWSVGAIRPRWTMGLAFRSGGEPCLAANRGLIA